MKSVGVIIKVVVMTAAFVGVILTMRSLRPPISTQNLNTEINWCETRVKSLATASGIKITQDRFKWVQTSPLQKELDPIAMEKWFGRNCRIKAQLAQADYDFTREAALALPTELSVEFIEGTSTAFNRAADGALIWKDKAFTSPELESAIQELNQIPEATIRN